LLLGRDGKEHSIADTGAAITSQAGKLEGIVLVFRDVTRERLHESEHETTMELLRLLNVHSETEGLIRGVTGLLHAWTGCEAVGIRLQEGDDYPYFETRGFPGEFVQAENYLCEREI